MILYKHENDIQIELLCRVCLKICDRPSSCSECRSLYCLDCLSYAFYYCYPCIFQEIGNPTYDIIYKLDPFSVQFLDKIKCLCPYCGGYILYQKYRNHKVNCKLIKTNFDRYNHLIQIYNSQYDLCFMHKQFCEDCFNQDVPSQNCQECKLYMIRRQDVLMNNDGIQSISKIQINEDLELSEQQFELKFSCSKCNLIIKYVDLQNHKLQCINFNKKGESKQIRLLKQKIERLDQTKCYINTNNQYQLQNFRELNQQCQKYLKRIDLIEQEQRKDSEIQ